MNEAVEEGLRIGGEDFFDLPIGIAESGELTGQAREAIDAFQADGSAVDSVVVTAEAEAVLPSERKEVFDMGDDIGDAAAFTGGKMPGCHTDADNPSGIFDEVKVKIGEIAAMGHDSIRIGMRGYEGSREAGGNFGDLFDTASRGMRDIGDNADLKATAHGLPSEGQERVVGIAGAADQCRTVPHEGKEAYTGAMENIEAIDIAAQKTCVLYGEVVGKIGGKVTAFQSLQETAPYFPERGIRFLIREIFIAPDGKNLCDLIEGKESFGRDLQGRILKGEPLSVDPIGGIAMEIDEFHE